MRAGGDDRVGEADPGVAVLAADQEGLLIDKGAVAGEPGDLAGLAQAVQTVGQLGDDLGFVTAQGLDINLRRTEAHSEFARRLGLFDHEGCMQQGFRRNAADIEADPAQPPALFDQADVLAQDLRRERPPYSRPVRRREQRRRLSIHAP